MVTKFIVDCIIYEGGDINKFNISFSWQGHPRIAILSHLINFFKQTAWLKWA